MGSGTDVAGYSAGPRFNGNLISLLVGSPGTCQHHITAEVFGQWKKPLRQSHSGTQNRAAGMRAGQITQCYKTYKERKEKGKTKKQVMLVEDEVKKKKLNTDNRAWYFF